jgi:hypothetical protein
MLNQIETFITVLALMITGFSLGIVILTTLILLKDVYIRYRYDLEYILENIVNIYKFIWAN